MAKAKGPIGPVGRPMSVRGRNVLITGSGQGIGKAVALRFARAGARVIVNDIMMENAQRTAEEIKGLNVDAIAVRADISVRDLNDAKLAAIGRQYRNLMTQGGAELSVNLSSLEGLPPSVTEMMKEVKSFCGKDGLAVLVNNAGIARPVEIARIAKINDIDLASQLDAVLAINLRSAYLVTSAAKALLDRACKKAPEEGAAVVNMSSVVSRIPIPGDSVYAGTKAALENITISHALELAPVRVNSVHPGFIATDLTTMPLIGALLGVLDKLVRQSEGKVIPGEQVLHWLEKRGLPIENKDALSQATLIPEILGLVTEETLVQLGRDKASETIPAGRLGEPGDVAETTFAAATIPYVTGSHFHVTGGLGLGQRF